MMTMVNGKPVSYNFLGTIAPIVSGFLGYKGAKSAADAQAANNALLKEQYEFEKQARAPAITGAKEALKNDFSPFVNAVGNTAVAAGNVGAKYLGDVPALHEAGRAGVTGYTNLAGMSADDVLALRNKFTDDAVKARYRLAADDINRQADMGQRARIAKGGRFDALSNQTARRQGEIERQRQDAILNAAAQAENEGYTRSQAEMARRLGLSGDLFRLGEAGLSRTSNVANLVGSAADAGINAPFMPYNAYSAAIGNAPKVNTPKYDTPTNPALTGLGLGLQAYNMFNPQKQGG